MWWDTNGWDVEIYPAVQPSNLTLPVSPIPFEQAEFMGASFKTYVGTRYWRSPQHSLRETWIKMLREITDDCLFVEADCLPCCDAVTFASMIKTHIASEIDKYSYNIFRPFRCLETADVPFNQPDSLKLLNMSALCAPTVRTGKLLTTANNREVWGTHALYIPEKSRKYVASILESIMLPVDSAIEFAVATGSIRGVCTSKSMFIQMDDESPYRLYRGLSNLVKNRMEYVDYWDGGKIKKLD